MRAVVHVNKLMAIEYLCKNKELNIGFNGHVDAALPFHYNFIVAVSLRGL